MVIEKYTKIYYRESAGGENANLYLNKQSLYIVTSLRTAIIEKFIKILLLLCKKKILLMNFIDHLLYNKYIIQILIKYIIQILIYKFISTVAIEQ